MNGFLLIDKPVGKTSFDICFSVRRALSIKRIGHTGTLDPFATGLLIIAVGKATKLIPYLDKAQKTYSTKVKLGATTETLDTESEELVLHDTDPGLTKEDIQEKINNHFIGDIEQVPPKYSALKIDGKRAYDLARNGEEVIMKKRSAFVHSCVVTGYDWPYVTCELAVAAGFYVRSFARDLGTQLLKDHSEQISQLSSGGYCVELRRTNVGAFSVNNAITLQELTEETVVIDPKEILSFPTVELTLAQQNELSFGRAFAFDQDFTGEVLLLINGVTIGLGVVNEKGFIQPKSVF